MPDYNALGPGYNTYMLSQYVSGPARTVTLASLPPGTHDYTNDFHLHILTGAGAGKRVKIGMVDTNTNTITFGGGEDPAVVNMIAVGDQVRSRTRCFSRSRPITATRFRTTTMSSEAFRGVATLYGWDQFRNPDGTPKYPQRPAPLVGPVGNYNSAGSVSTGHFHGPTKVIVAQSVMDIDAFPWCADWYRGCVKADKEAQGQSLDDHFRLWFTDHAQHTGRWRTPAPGRSATGACWSRALRDLEAWAEQGVPPPASTQLRGGRQPDRGAADRRGAPGASSRWST